MNVYDKKEECCGCTACMNICPKNAIQMVSDEEGFLYPKIDKQKCIECGLCKKICAFQNGYNIEDRVDKPYVYATKSKSDKIRMQSSSGGMFTEISNYILENDGIVYGAAFNEDLKVEHIRCEDKVQRDKCCGSKYSQSDLGDIYNQVKKDLENGKLVLFTGTPCQVGGLNRFLGNTDKEKLILVDIICHGPSSPKIFNEYIQFCEKKRKAKIAKYYHRAKDVKWEHYEKAIYENGKEDKKSLLSQAWKHIFWTDLALRPSCYNCKYTNTKRASDITIADFWGIEKFAPEFADKKGVSLVIVNTNKGKEVFNNINNKIEYIERTIEEAQEKNPQLKEHIKNDKEARKEFWNMYYKKGFNYIIKKYGRYNLVSKTKQIIKRVIGKDE
jgi:coenzyme F420-reducing hydrogenase beta subunit